ncbi:MAG: hypothetical protein DSO07_08590 [Thermoproteota archaeon]|jgi:dihydroorotase-like cyclic amidohydrolase|uniref:Amidohydrolase-related domain-containing protein n=1 Tax=Candidatus Methanodesulfokora washburnensis TaxID=2478471 RepID=A0A429GCB6_9CREN|nr:dihydroorotase family protein [Candidatus Methanodesulfokores washburnensis]RSN71429.1 hypothetical protein D6D85_16035 [Candidatus Methanodesulfokores washburnensis]RZN58430.1 MAG: hypothetical protein EF810_07490 [Candidatus Methanodesulfokores washburnensis]TDA40667.1 MAG: hypothetical protein DSO07_08590 [Candidatus Korarchaeota archaeon]
MTEELDLLIEGKIYSNGEIVEAYLGVVDGKVAGIWISGTFKYREKRALESKEVALPGMMDIHVHMRGLEQSYKEDWFSGTEAALRGGVTAILDMPNNKPWIRDENTLMRKMEEAKNMALVDYGFYLGVPRSAGELDKVKDFVVGIKIYPDEISDYLDPILQRAKELGLFRIFHAEVEGDEVKGIRTVMKFIEKYGGHITHVSSAEGVRLLLSAKSQGIEVSMDTCPHYIWLTERDIDWRGYVRPRIKSSMDMTVIKSSVKSCLFDAISTDHAPHTEEEKKGGATGIPGLETALPLLFTSVYKGEFPLKAIDLYSRNPADIFGVKKGCFLPGNDADIVIYDYSDRRKIRGSDFSSKAKFTPFEGFEVVGRVSSVYIRGVLALDEGDLKVSRGFGKPIVRGKSFHFE